MLVYFAAFLWFYFLLRLLRQSNILWNLQKRLDIQLPRGLVGLVGNTSTMGNSRCCRTLVGLSKSWKIFVAPPRGDPRVFPPDSYIIYGQQVQWVYANSSWSRHRPSCAYKSRRHQRLPGCAIWCRGNITRKRIPSRQNQREEPPGSYRRWDKSHWWQMVTNWRTTGKNTATDLLLLRLHCSFHAVLADSLTRFANTTRKQRINGFRKVWRSFMVC